MTNYRASAAPVAMLCAGSVNPNPDEILIDSVNPAGVVGTAVHEVLQDLPETGDFNQNKIIQICDEHGLSVAQGQEISTLCWAGKRFWDRYGHEFHNPVVEHGMEYRGDGFCLTGHKDVFGVSDDGKRAQELDYKTTRLDVNYRHQMMAYADLTVQNFPDIEEIMLTVVYLRDSTADIKKVTREEVENWHHTFVKDVVHWDNRTFRPGSHCGYCRRFATCPALKEMNQGSIEQLGMIPLQDEYLPVSPVTVDMYQRVKALSTVIDRFKEMVKATVEQAGGELVGTNGQRLVLIPQSRDHINAALAWPVISPILTRDELAEVTQIKKTDMLAAIATHAPRGQKGKAKTAIMDKLNEAGAVTKTEFTALRAMQPKQEAKEIELGD